jgi:putative transposase
MPLPLIFQFVAVFMAGWVIRVQQDVIAYQRAEIAVLRELLNDGRLLLTPAQRRRLAQAGKPLGRRGLEGVATLVTPDTVLRWFRELVARKYDGSRRRKGGTPKTAAELAALVVQVAQENVTFGYTRIRDTLHHLGHDLGRSTVQRILAERGIVPAPERKKQNRWRDFLTAHAATLCATDFFSVEILTLVGIVRYQVIFVMHVATRRVHLAGVVRDDAVDGAWTTQLARNLTDAEDGFLSGMRYLIVDRDPLFVGGFRELLQTSGVKVLRLPRESPNLNAHAERWVRSCRDDVLRRLVIFGEQHLRHVLHSYVDHFNAERPHQGLDGALVQPDPRAANRSGSVRRQDRLGGLLRFYYRAAA